MASDGGVATLAERDGASILRFLQASLGRDATAVARETLETADRAVREGDADAASRGRLFAIARKRAAAHVEKRRGDGADAAGPAALVRQIRPTEREALLLRYVGELPLAELVVATGADETTVRQRISRALAQLLRDGAKPPSDATTDVAAMRRRVEDHLYDILEGLAPDDVADFVADDDGARDLVHDAGKLVDEVRALGNDVVVDLAALSASAAPLEPVPPAPVATEAVHEEAGESADVTAPMSAAAPEPAAASGATAPPAPVATPVAPAATIAVPSSRKSAGGSGRLGVAAVSIAAIAAIAFAASRSNGPTAHSGEAWSGKVDRISAAFGGGAGLERCSPDGRACAPIATGDPVPAGSVLRTDGRTRAVVALADGTRISLDRESELRLDGDAPRRALLDHGAAIVDVPYVGDTPARVLLPLGFFESKAAKVSVNAIPERAFVEVVRGVARLVDAEDHGVSVHAGEAGRLEPGRPTEVRATAALGSSLRWSEGAFEVPKERADIQGLGELRAKKPGEDRERTNAVKLASHATRVRIVGNVARTEIEEEFSNATPDVLEGIFRFPLPPGAQIERLALDVDGKMVDGAFVDRDRASAIWNGAIVNAGAKRKPEEEIIWVPGPWRDPALLEWQRGGRFELRVYPVPKQGSRRVILAYTEVLPPSGDLRRYVYPLPHDPSGSTKVGHFDFDVQVRGNDPAVGVRPWGYSLRTEATPDGATAASFHADDFTPDGDLTLEFALPDRGKELTAWAYQPADTSQDLTAGGAGSTDPYIAVALRPRLPLVTDGTRRSFAFVVDSSRSMFGERYRRASELAVRLTRELSADDIATVLACDSTCRELPGGAASGGESLARAVTDFLGAITPEGGSDVAGAIGHARSALHSAARGSARVVYIGDGTPTIGPVQPAFLRREIEAVPSAEAGNVTTVAIGGDADSRTLSTIATAGGGVMIPYAPGATVEEAAYAVLGATYGNALSDVEVETAGGLAEILPRRLGTIPSGGEVMLTARMTRPAVDGSIVLRGKIGGVPFEQRYPLNVEATTAKGNAFVPRLWAAAKIADLEDESDAESRKTTVALSGQFHVASRYTSLLVLESSAMFQAFGLDRKQQETLWTGDDDATATTSDGELAVAEQAPKDELELGADKAKEDSRPANGGLAAPAAKAAAPAAEPSMPMRPSPAPMKRRAALDPFDDDLGASSGAFSPPPPAQAPAGTSGGALPRERNSASEVAHGGPLQMQDDGLFGGRDVMRRPMIPMRKVWDRVGRITPGAASPGSVDALERAEASAMQSESRDAVKKLFTLALLAGDLSRAAAAAERWSTKEPLDPDALTARADVAAARGERELAIRILGSVVDVRPGDHKAQWRLARLHRWAGRPELGCRHSLAVAQIRPNDGKLVAEAVRCSRDVGLGALATELLAAADDATRRTTEALLEKPAVDPAALLGDVQIRATWDGGDDLDVALLPSDGSRISWLGAPSRAIITANDVTSTGREGLALNGADPGDYLVEVTRPEGHRGTVRGTLDVTAAGERQRVPFVLEGGNARVATLKITTRSRLVPL